MHSILVIDEWGLYSATLDHRVADPNSTTGHKTLSRDVRLIERTHQICAQIGTRFGIRFHVRNDVPAQFVNVSVNFEHPPIVNDHGVMQSRDEVIRQIPAHLSWYTGWTFVEPRELVPGEWHIMVRHGSATDIDETFHVHTGCAAPVS